MSTRDQLAGIVHDQALWREQKAREYPDDDRNVHSATALHSLAKWVAGLPDDDPRLARLTLMSQQLAVEIGDLCHGDESGRWVSRYQFDQYHRVSEDEWLSGLVGRVAQETGKRRWDDLRPDGGPQRDAVGPKQLAERVAGEAETVARLASELAGTAEEEISEAERNWLWAADDALAKILAGRGLRQDAVT